MAKKKKYDWVLGGELPVIDVHSIAKHRVLERYLFRYIEVLTANPARHHLNLHLVDGFAGGGLYTDKDRAEVLRGSPLILLDTVKEAEVRCNLERRKPLTIDARYYFIDMDQGALEHLSTVIDEWGHGEQQRSGNVQILAGDFSVRVRDAITLIRGRSKNARAIFLLDQYGYKDAPLEAIRAIFDALPNAEIVLNFAADSLVNFLEDSERSRLAVGRVGAQLVDRIDWASIQRLKEEDADWRLVIEKELAEALRVESRARYATRFFIRSTQSNRAYWLVHLCQHPKAYDEMLLLHYQMQNTFTRVGPAGFWVPGYDPRADGDLGQNLALEFDFDALAKDRSRDALREQLPELITGTEGIRFADLRDTCFNRTPAHQGIVQDAVFKLAQDMEVEVVTPGDRSRRVAHTIGDDDIVRRRHQRVFEFIRTK